MLRLTILIALYPIMGIFIFFALKFFEGLYILPIFHLWPLILYWAIIMPSFFFYATGPIIGFLMSIFLFILFFLVWKKLTKIIFKKQKIG